MRNHKKKIAAILFLLFANTTSQGSSSAMHKKYSFDEFTLEYRWSSDFQQIQFTISAPTNGWVALGLNTHNQLTGSDLTMFAVHNGIPVLDDRYIVAPGDHKADVTLGGKNDLRLNMQSVNPGHTILQFERDARINDRYNLTLKPGQKIWALLAYSTHPQFDHHSRKRIHRQIEL